MGRTGSRGGTVVESWRWLGCGRRGGGGIGVNYESVDTTALCNAMMESIAGRGTVSIGVAAKYNNATNRSHDVIQPLNGNNTGATLVIEFGDNAAPTTGDASFTVTTCVVRDYTVSADGGDVKSAWTWTIGEGSTAVWGTVA